MFEHLTSHRAEGCAVWEQGSVRSWGDLRDLTTQLRRALAALGEPRRRVLYLPQSGASIALLAASEAEQIDVVLVSTLYPESRAIECLESTHAQSVLTLDGTRLVERERGPSAVTSRAAGEQAKVLILTSGSSGKPKCVEHTWQSLAGAAKVRPELEGKRWLLAYPLSHFASTQVLAQCVLNHGTLVIPLSFDPTAVMNTMIEGRAECISATPTLFRQLLVSAPNELWARTSIEQITLGGEVVDQRIIDAIKKVRRSARISHIYASTEAGAVLTVSDGLEGFDASLLDGKRLKLVDGELHVLRTAGRAMARYLDREQPSDWWATGDLIEVKEGRARFLGRQSDLINVGAFKVNPVEVEKVLLEVEGVQDVCVVGHQSSLAGQLVKAIICPAPPDAARFKAALIEHCKKKLPPHMIPRLFEFAAEIPPSVNMKRARRANS